MKIKDLLETVQDVEITPEQEKQIKEYLGIKDSKKFVPRQDELYYCINSDLSYSCMIYNKNWPYDVTRLTIGNCFKTTKEVEFTAEKIRVYQELKQFADENNDPMDWNDKQQKKYTFFYEYLNSSFVINFYHQMACIGAIYFSSAELVQKALTKVGEDRIKRYLFGVE